MSSLVLVVGLVCGGMTIYVGAMIGVMRRRLRCPACGKTKLAMKSLVRGHVWPPVGRPIDESFYQCEACREQFCRQGNGPLIAKEAWEAGARGEIPTATVVPPRDRS